MAMCSSQYQSKLRSGSEMLDLLGDKVQTLLYSIPMEGYQDTAHSFYYLGTARTCSSSIAPKHIDVSLFDDTRRMDSYLYSTGPSPGARRLHVFYLFHTKDPNGSNRIDVRCTGQSIPLMLFISNNTYQRAVVYSIPFTLLKNPVSMCFYSLSIHLRNLV